MFWFVSIMRSILVLSVEFRCCSHKKKKLLTFKSVFFLNSIFVYKLFWIIYFYIYFINLFLHDK